MLGYIEIHVQFGEAENETRVKQLQMSKQTYTVYYPDQQIHNIYIYIYIYIYSDTSANEDNSFRNHIR